MKCGVNVKGDMNAEGVQLSIIMLCGYSTPPELYFACSDTAGSTHSYSHLSPVGEISSIDRTQNAKK